MNGNREPGQQLLPDRIHRGSHGFHAEFTHMPTRLLMLCVYSVVVLLLAMMPSVHVPMMQPIDVGLMLKPAHIAAFIVFTLLLRYTIDLYTRARFRATLLTALLAFLFGALIEGIQLFIPYRSGRLADLLSNAIGIAIGLIVFFMLQRKKYPRR